MPRYDKTEKRTIRGKEVSFSQKKLKSGEIAYYRDGKRVESYYQRRLARGVLAGKSVAEARGHPFGAYSGKLLTRSEIREQEEFSLGQWAEPPRADARGREKATYYMKVMVTTESVKKVGSPTGEGDVCEPKTLQLADPDTNDQSGFTYSSLARRFERIATFTLKKYGLEPCTGDLKKDILRVWRHSRR